MKSKTYTYESDDVEVRYDVARCIHAAECVRGLPHVFDSERRPWIDPEQASADQILEVVMRCPTGALHLVRKDGGVEEAVPEKNSITIDPDGPLYLCGDVEIIATDDALLLKDTRVALCRCGASKNKPFCDGTHVEIDFADPGQLQDVRVKPPKDDADRTLAVRPSHNGPLLVQGPLELYGAAGREPVRGSQAAFCRCGHSHNKPFCDGTHNKVGFTAE